MIRSSHSAGFTLVEVIASIGIFLIIIAAVGVFEGNVFSYQRTATGSFETVQDAQVIMKTLSREIRMASQGSDGSYALQVVATNTLMFFADTNGDGIKERIRYTLSGATLYRASLTPTGSPLAYSGTESTTTLVTDAANGSSSLFSYFDDTYVGTSTGALAQPVTPTAVRLIQINLVLDTNPNQAPASRTYTTDVTLRNLKDNL